MFAGGAFASAAFGAYPEVAQAGNRVELADAPVNSLAWAVYRQALRDLTKQDGFPWSVVWPDMPA